MTTHDGLDRRRYLTNVLKPEGALESMGGGVPPFEQWRAEYDDGRWSDAELASAYRALHALDAPDGALGDTSALEAIVLPAERPVLTVRDGRIGEVRGTWSELNARDEVLRPTIAAVGRIQTRGLSAPYTGTGFLVGDGLMMTNRHVAEAFCAGFGFLGWTPSPSAEVDLRQELGSDAQHVLRVGRVVLVHPVWDFALLEVEPVDGTALPPHLTLVDEEPQDTHTASVLVVGYPYFKGLPDPALEKKIFGGVHSKKRVQPGKLRGYAAYRPSDARWPEVRALCHDASTLGGNSGSCVASLATGRVLGLHFAGEYLVSNYAVPAWELARDARVRDAGVVFERAETLPEGRRESAPEVRSPSAPQAASADARAPGTWFEQAGDDAIVQGIYDDPHTRAMLERALGAATARAVREAVLQGGSKLESLRQNDRPSLVIVHGFLGSHLDDRGGLGGRVWLTPTMFLPGQFSDRLALRDDGSTDARMGQTLAASGPLRVIYGAADLAWRAQGFAVHHFAYDWRKGVARAADRLARYLDDLAESGDGRPVVLVAHSMGGVVAAAYARRHATWSERVASAVLIGVPLAGTFAPVELMLGTHPLARRLADLQIGDDVGDIASAARTFTGALDLLPDPSSFEGVDALYDAARWPLDRARSSRPSAQWLQASRSLKGVLRESPLLHRSAFIVGAHRATPQGIIVQDHGFAVHGDGPGDDTVPLRSALPEGKTGWRSGFPHSLMPLDPWVLRLVPDLAQGIPIVNAERVTRDMGLTESTGAAPKRAEALRPREFDAAWVRWLLSRDGVTDDGEGDEPGRGGLE